MAYLSNTKAAIEKIIGHKLSDSEADRVAGAVMALAGIEAKPEEVEPDDWEPEWGGNAGAACSTYGAGLPVPAVDCYERNIHIGDRLLYNGKLGYVTLVGTPAVLPIPLTLDMVDLPPSPEKAQIERRWDAGSTETIWLGSP